MLNYLLEQQRKRREEDGFTLIELLIVIVVLGILAAIVIFSVAGINDRGQQNACKTDARSIETAEEAFFAQPVTPPKYTDVAGLVTAGVLHDASTLWNVTSPDSWSTYTLVPIGTTCPTPAP